MNSAETAKAKLKWLLVLALAVIILAGCSQGAQVTVSKVYDGDSFVMSNGDEIRLIGIDAPERDRPGAEEARTFLTNLIQGKPIRLERDKEDKDKYQRLLRYAYINGIFVNAEMIKQGYAVTLFIPPNDFCREKFTILETAARESKKGLWAPEAKDDSGTKKEDTQEIIVYVTRTGSKYHRGDCQYLSKSKIPMKLKDAKAKGYEPCKICRPPE